MEANSTQVVEFVSEDTCRIATQDQDFTGTFTFDRVFGIDSQQSDVFDYTIKETVGDLLKGYNGTVFAYGQTGSGKSYTMMGPDIDDRNSRGIIPRIINQIFDSIRDSPENMEYIVAVSYMEIYMERIRDLLKPEKSNLPIHEDKDHGVYVKGLSEVYVGSKSEVYQVMKEGGKNRAVAATKMNEESSRSHSIFLVDVNQKNTETGSAKKGRLFLVDLAGSEKIGKTGASGQTLEEAKKINKSLSSLGMVINALTDGKSTHIPYRDSKLTRILQESLGGNSRTSLIINCSPSSFNEQETLSTLRFGQRAKKIKNKAKINAELSPAELRRLVKLSQLQNEANISYISKLEGELTGWRCGKTPETVEWVELTGGIRAGNAGGGETTATHKTTQSLSQPSRSETPKSGRNTPQNGNGRITPSRSLTPGRLKRQILLQSSPRQTALLSDFLAQDSEHDRQEEILRRENELEDLIAERDATIQHNESVIEDLTKELDKLRTNSANKSKFEIEIETLKTSLGKARYDVQELELEAVRLREMNGHLSRDADTSKELIQKWQEEQARQKEEDERDEKEKTKQKSKEEEEGTKITQLWTTIDKLLSSSNDEDSKTILNALKQKLNVSDITTINTSSSFNRVTVEKLLTLSNNALNDPTTATISTLQSYLSDLKNKTPIQESSGNKLDPNVDQNVVIEQLRSDLQDASSAKNSIMKDLHDQCSKYVELQLELEQTKESLGYATRDKASRYQRKRMLILEKNLEQLTHIQKQLVDQNAALQKDIAISQRILNTRNKRIKDLEIALQESQMHYSIESESFEQNLGFLTERFNHIKNASLNAIEKMTEYNNNINNDDDASSIHSVESDEHVNLNVKIVRPLRGGGGIVQSITSPVPKPTITGAFKQNNTNNNNLSTFAYESEVLSPLSPKAHASISPINRSPSGHHKTQSLTPIPGGLLSLGDDYPNSQNHYQNRVHKSSSISSQVSNCSNNSDNFISRKLGWIFHNDPNNPNNQQSVDGKNIISGNPNDREKK